MNILRRRVIKMEKKVGVANTANGINCYEDMIAAVRGLQKSRFELDTPYMRRLVKLLRQSERDQ